MLLLIFFMAFSSNTAIETRDLQKELNSDVENVSCQRALNWLKPAGIIGISYGLYMIDDEVQTWVQKERNQITDTIANLANCFGDGRYTVPALLSLYLYGKQTKDKKACKVALMGIKSLVISGLLSECIKFLTHRHRPSSAAIHNIWDGPRCRSTRLSSFPSGHTTVAFSVATVIATEYKDKKIIPPLFYGIATLTGLARLNNNAHWLSDVFVGACVGYFTAKAIIKIANKK